MPLRLTLIFTEFCEAGHQVPMLHLARYLFPGLRRIDQPDALPFLFWFKTERVTPRRVLHLVVRYLAVKKQLVFGFANTLARFFNTLT